MFQVTDLSKANNLCVYCYCARFQINYCVNCFYNPQILQHLQLYGLYTIRRSLGSTTKHFQPHILLSLLTSQNESFQPLCRLFYFSPTSVSSELCATPIISTLGRVFTCNVCYVHNALMHDQFGASSGFGV